MSGRTDTETYVEGRRIFLRSVSPTPGQDYRSRIRYTISVDVFGVEFLPG